MFNSVAHRQSAAASSAMTVLSRVSTGNPFATRIRNELPLMINRSARGMLAMADSSRGHGSTHHYSTRTSRRSATPPPPPLSRSQRQHRAQMRAHQQLNNKPENIKDRLSSKGGHRAYR